MTKKFRNLVAAAAVVTLLGTAGATAGDHKTYTTYTTQGAFNDVMQDLQDAVVNRGYVIDFVGHVDAMLERTSETVGSVTEAGSKSPYINAKYVQFCSAKLTHEAISASPMNLTICPNVVFAYETRSAPGKVTVGYRRPAGGPSKKTRKILAKIEDMLDGIAKEAVSQ